MRKYLSAMLTGLAAGIGYTIGEKLVRQVEIDYARISQRLIDGWNKIVEDMGILDVDKEK
jgi:hypothetical protein